MQKINFKWAIYLVAILLMVAGSAWADSGRGRGPHQGYSSGSRHGGQFDRHGGPHAKNHNRFRHAPRYRPHGHHFYGRRAPWGYPHGRHFYPRHRYPRHFYPRHRHSGAGYRFSATILNPGFAFGITTGSRW